jgi:ABC-type lipoprotein release transport system permease subunit
MAISFWFMWKKGYRTLIKNKSKTIPILFLMIFSITFGSIMFNYQDIRDSIVDDALDETNFADGFIYTEPINRSIIIPIIEGFSNKVFEEYEARMLLSVTYEINHEEHEGVLVGVDTSKKEHINALVEADRDELDDYENTLNWHFASPNDIEEGDKITIIIGSKEKEEKIENIGFNPEFSFCPLYDDMPYPSTTAFPVFYVDLLYLTRNFINSSYNTPIINSIVYKLKDDVDNEDAEDEIKENLSKYLNKIITQYDHPYVAMMREDRENDQRTLMIMSIMIILGSVITLTIVVHKLVEKDLKNVSVFQGLGANKAEIIGSYIIFNFLLVVISLISGTILNFIFGLSINQKFANLSGVPFTITPYININNILFFSLILFSTSLIATLFIVIKTFKMDIQETLKYETQFLKKTNFIEKIALKFNKRLNPFTKYNLRRIFGRKLYLILLFFSLGFSASMIFMAFSVQDSFQYSIDVKLNEVEKWDGFAKTWQYENESTLEDDFDSLSEVDEFEFGIADSVLLKNVSTREYDIFLLLMAFEEKSKLHLLKAENGAKIEKNTEVLVSKDLILRYNFAVGDTIKIKRITSNDSHNVEIIGFVNDMTSNTIYVSMNMAQKVMEESNKINAIYFKAKDKINDAIEQVQDFSKIKRVISKKSLKGEYESTLELLMSFMIIMGSFFVGFGIVMTATIINSIFEYRLEDYGKMKAFGLLDSEIRKSVLKEIIFYFLITIFIGAILGALITSYMLTFTIIASGLYYHAYPISYLYFNAICFIVITTITLLQLRKIRKMNVAELLKMKTFG